jgi:Domain of unknown function (DUF1902)
MKHSTIIVRADWDDEAKVWVATSTDIDGLATEADTLEALRGKVLAMVAELLELNGEHSDLPGIPVHIVAQQTARVANPHFP